MKLPEKIKLVSTFSENKVNEIINFLEYFIRETERCCTCNGCPKHKGKKECNHGYMWGTTEGSICRDCGKLTIEEDTRKSQCNDCFDGDHAHCSGGPCECWCWGRKEKTLAQKFQAFREKRGNGSGKDYWQGLEDIANEYYHNL